MEELECQANWLAEGRELAIPSQLQKDSIDPDSTMNIIAVVIYPRTGDALRIRLCQLSSQANTAPVLIMES